MSDGQLVVLLSEKSTGETDDGGAVGKDADDVGAVSDLLVEPLLWVVRPDLVPLLSREGGEGQDVLEAIGKDLRYLHHTGGRYCLKGSRERSGAGRTTKRP